MNQCMYVCILNWPLPIGAFQHHCKQTMINKYSNKHKYVKNPNWRQADQLAIYKRSREVELGATENNISYWSERAYGFQIRRSNHSATLPPFLTNHTHNPSLTWVNISVSQRVSKPFSQINHSVFQTQITFSKSGSC